ncbi:MAG: carboxylating nicotinate-nucleotide diphosphorylase [Kiritimatiellia bacterium]
MKSLKVNSAARKPWLDSSVRAFVRSALAEDIGRGDITSRALIEPGRRLKAVIIARNECVVAGLEVARLVFRAMDSKISCRLLLRDGARAVAGRRIMVLEGPARSILAAERTALNFLQRLTGIATLTARYVKAAGRRRVVILDTRKTTPNMRLLEKYAVRCGGGRNHRMGLYDMVLMKDNHRFLWTEKYSLAAAVRAARRRYPGVPVEVEVESVAQLKDALAALPEWIMLDNMSVPLMRRCVRICAGRCRLEASGGISLQNAGAAAATGVDAISIGALTHSAAAADLSLEVCH